MTKSLTKILVVGGDEGEKGVTYKKLDCIQVR